VQSWPAPSRPVAVPIGGEGRSLGTIAPGAFAAGSGLQLCGTAPGPLEVEIWQVRYPNPGGPSRLRTTLSALAPCPRADPDSARSAAERQRAEG
jgi:hypothetical protein